MTQISKYNFIQGKYEELSIELGKKDKEMMILRNDLGVVKNEASQLRLDLSSAQEQLAASTLENDQLQSNLLSYKDINNQMNIQIQKTEQLKKSYDVVIRDRDELRSKNQRMKSHLEQLYRKIKEYEDERWLILRPLTFSASAKYGSSTRWCTTYQKEKNYRKSIRLVEKLRASYSFLKSKN